MKYRAMGSYRPLFSPIIAKLALFVTHIAIAMAIVSPVFSSEPTVDSTLKTVATIRPVYSLLSALTQGVSKPDLLIKYQASPHNYNLRPSEKRLLNDADLIFWIGPELETFLPTVLATIPPQHQHIRLDKSPGLLLLPTRTGKAWEEEIHEEHENDEHGHHHHHGHNDPHIWLSPNNAAKMSAYMAQILIQRDPQHKKQYEQNLKKLKLKLKNLDTAIQKQLKNAKDVPFLVFHDGYQYFEQAYGLKGAGAISLNPELPISAHRLERVQEKIKGLGVRCLFSEPQWGTNMVDALARKYNIRVSMLDPLGAETPNPSEDYLINLQDLSKKVASCLSKDKLVLFSPNGSR
jgi:zinc transport system substrate-binding protein